MPTDYNLYINDGAGGPIDYDTPVATVLDGAPTAATVAVARPGDWRFGVRAFDRATGLEERNIDAVARLILDAAGADLSARPAPPRALSARATAGGGCAVRWAWAPAAGAGTPTSFKVWIAAGAIDYGVAPGATVPFVAGAGHFAVDLAGLADGVSYVAGVRASNAAGDEPNTITAAVVGSAAGPAPADDLAANPTARAGR